MRGWCGFLFAQSKHAKTLPALALAALLSIPHLAHAQCALTNGSTGTTPWPSCTTWTGPAWPLWYGTAKPVVLAYSEQPIIDSLDINGDGRADLLYQTPASAFTATNLNGAAISTGTGFGNPVTGATPIAGGSLQSAANLSIGVEI